MSVIVMQAAFEPFEHNSEGVLRTLGTHPHLQNKSYNDVQLLSFYRHEGDVHLYTFDIDCAYDDGGVTVLHVLTPIPEDKLGTKRWKRNLLQLCGIVSRRTGLNMKAVPHFTEEGNELVITLEGDMSKLRNFVRRCRVATIQEVE